MRAPRWGFIASSAVVGLLFASGPAFQPVVAADAVYTFVGLGNGHGRGMGQWGAFGYAQMGWTAEKIVGHFYPDATLGKAPAAPITVRLEYRDGKNLDVTSDAGMSIDGQKVAPGQAIHLDLSGNYTVTDGCNGGQVSTGHSDSMRVDPITAGINRPENEHLQFCGGNAYRGSLGLADDGGAKTVNTVDVDDYLRGVIPSEMMAGWADKNGFEALRAQAIAARSYSLSEHRTDYAQTCDTQSCQVYAGSSIEDPRTDKAVQSTAGTVLMQDGKILRAEYSASTGGLTASGIVDEGDRVAPGHWEKAVTAGDIGKAFGVGNVESVEVTKAQDRHVTSVHIVGSDKTIDVSNVELNGKLDIGTNEFQIIVPGALPAPKPGEPAVPAPQDVPTAPVPQLPISVPTPETVQEMAGLAGSLSGPVLQQVIANLQHLLAPASQ
ncbi:SpoIID/LytB domain-containing protein [Smaragdicoccus niigatensis]|uniref:SpoIID/LytB domain-containing protein n=1 Tax=Smaragdicoccus niigatensis TaxID=359359 RepID=UPI00036ABC71|nr:SpoIID/LytB domain-containing protein [Smaragdicoccus niigatensis]